MLRKEPKVSKLLLVISCSTRAQCNLNLELKRSTTSFALKMHASSCSDQTSFAMRGRWLTRSTFRDSLKPKQGTTTTGKRPSMICTTPGSGMMCVSVHSPSSVGRQELQGHDDTGFGPLRNQRFRITTLGVLDRFQ
jgi:hypothetical protein